MQAFFQKYLSKPKGRFYCIYVDFSKAFDSVPHSLLWYKLYKSGLHGNIMKVLQDMYKQAVSCTLTPEGLSEHFINSVGTRQGCLLSHILFILYLNTWIESCKQMKRKLKLWFLEMGAV